MSTEGGKPYFSQAPFRGPARILGTGGCSGHGRIRPVTLVIFWVCGVVEKVVEKTARPAAARTWSKARKNAAPPNSHLVRDYISIL